MSETAQMTMLYAEVQHFYARQMHRLDGGDFPAYAATFTLDGEFSHTPGREPARTRAGITAELYDFNQKYAADPVQRRHLFTMIDIDGIEGQGDGGIRSTCYALVVKTRPGSDSPEFTSCVVHDVLVRVDGELLTKSRRVDYDKLM
jgi:actinorhodin biosynthesis protein ActVIA